MLTTAFGESASRARRREETRVGFSRSVCALAGVPPTRSSAQWLQCDLQRNPRVPGVRYSVRPPSRGRASHRRTSSACPRHRHARLSGYRYPGLRMCLSRQIRYSTATPAGAVACSVRWAWGGQSRTSGVFHTRLRTVVTDFVYRHVADCVTSKLQRIVDTHVTPQILRILTRVERACTSLGGAAPTVLLCTPPPPSKVRTNSQPRRDDRGEVARGGSRGGRWGGGKNGTPLYEGLNQD